MATIPIVTKDQYYDSQKHCNNRECQLGAEKMLKCGQCRQAIYCSKECQKSDWPKHKSFCKRIAKGLADGDSPKQDDCVTSIRLLNKVLTNGNVSKSEEAALAALNMIIMTAMTNEKLIKNYIGSSQLISDVATLHSNSSSVQARTCRVIGMLSSNRVISSEMGEVGLCAVVANALNKFQALEDLVVDATVAIVSLAALTPANQSRFFELGVVQSLNSAYTLHDSKAFLSLYPNAMSAVCQLPDAKSQAISLGFCEQLVKMIERYYSDDVAVVRSSLVGFRAMTSDGQDVAVMTRFHGLQPRVLPLIPHLRTGLEPYDLHRLCIYFSIDPRAFVGKA